jgi:hypothetical protein
VTDDGVSVSEQEAVKAVLTLHYVVLIVSSPCPEVFREPDKEQGVFFRGFFGQHVMLKNPLSRAKVLVEVPVRLALVPDELRDLLKLALHRSGHNGAYLLG